MQDSTDQPEHERYTTSIPKAGKKYFGIGRSASYEAAKRGEIPTVNIGRKKLASIPAIERKIAEA